MTQNIMNWNLSTLRARIHLRLIQLGVRIKRRTRIVHIVGRVNSVTRLIAFAAQLESRCPAGQPPWGIAKTPAPFPGTPVATEPAATTGAAARTAGAK